MIARLLEAAGNSATRYRTCLMAGVISALAVTTAMGQYQVREWANFEDGKLPPNLITIGGNWQSRMQVVPVDSVTDQGTAFKNPELGSHVLKLEAAPSTENASTWQVGLAVGEVLDRTQLGPNSRALFQADFFVPAQQAPSIAVLAMEPPDGNGKHVDSIKRSFYRFGMTKADRAYFSQVSPGEETATQFHQDNELFNQMPKPGWHRFAIVCEGPSIIRCYIDGREAAFSPLEDTSMKQIMVGLLLADNERQYTAYADNLSIQLSDDALALPASPYDSGWSVAARSSSRAATVGASTAQPTAQVSTALAAEWLPPVQAWNKAKAENKGLLLYFYAPGVQRVEQINQILATDPAAKEYMSKHACARVDVNQLEGGSIAKKYQIFKVPAFLVIAPDAQSSTRSLPGQGATWQQIAADLAPL